MQTPSPDQHWTYSALLVLQDVVASLVLSEAVYKIMDLDRQSALQAVRNAAHEFPSELQQDLHLQWSLPHVHHR